MKEDERPPIPPSSSWDEEPIAGPCDDDGIPEEACHYIGSSNTGGEEALDYINKHLGWGNLCGLKIEKRGIRSTSGPHIEVDWDGEDPEPEPPTTQEWLAAFEEAWGYPLLENIYGCRVIYAGNPQDSGWPEQLTLAYKGVGTYHNIDGPIEGYCGGGRVDQAIVSINWYSPDQTYRWNIGALEAGGVFYYWTGVSPGEGCTDVECQDPRNICQDGFCAPLQVGCDGCISLETKSDCYEVGESFPICIKWNPDDPSCNPNIGSELEVAVSWSGSAASKLTLPSSITIDFDGHPPYTGCSNAVVTSSLSKDTLTMHVDNQTECDVYSIEFCGETYPPIEPEFGSHRIVTVGLDCGEQKYNCCRYMPKNFIPWSGGVGVPVLIPPNKRSK